MERERAEARPVVLTRTRRVPVYRYVHGSSLTHRVRDVTWLRRSISENCLVKGRVSRHSIVRNLIFNWLERVIPVLMLGPHVPFGFGARMRRVAGLDAEDLAQPRNASPT